MMRRADGGFRAVLAVLAVVVAAMLALAPWARPASAADPFAAFVEGLWAEAKAPPYSVSRATFDRAFAGVTPDLSLPDLVIPGRAPPKSSGQAEFVRAPQEYISDKQIDGLAAQGRTLARQHAATLARIESEIGVEAPVVLAIWGRETAFGSHQLKHSAIRVLATQAYVGRRKDMFRTELLWALKMIETGLATPEQMKASWAGAMGLTQFMPSEFFQTARSLAGGRADLFRSVPDALASAANQLKVKGWVTGLKWGYEIAIPQGADCALEGPTQARKLAEWQKMGFRRLDGGTWSARELAAEAYLMSPGGSNGPSFLVTENYKVIRRYNMSDLYATFVGTLSDRISGGSGFVTRWRDIRQLQESEVAEIQRRLKALGADIEKLDGKIGSNTRKEIGAYQRKVRLAVDCWPSAGLLQHLTQARP